MLHAWPNQPSSFVLVAKLLKMWQTGLLNPPGQIEPHHAPHYLIDFNIVGPLLTARGVRTRSNAPLGSPQRKICLWLQRTCSKYICDVWGWYGFTLGSAKTMLSHCCMGTVVVAAPGSPELNFNSLWSIIFSDPALIWEARVLQLLSEQCVTSSFIKCCVIWCEYIRNLRHLGFD